MLWAGEREKLREIRDDRRATAGVGNVLGNKGGVAIALRLDGATRFVFVTAHFAAHDAMVEQRNSDFQRINSGLFSSSGGGCWSACWSGLLLWLRGALCMVGAALLHGWKVAPYESRDDDVTVWLGDFNYRLENGDRRCWWFSPKSMLHPRSLFLQKRGGGGLIGAPLF
jgi:hypothetical protein